MADNSKLSQALMGNRNAAKDYVRKKVGDAGAAVGGLAEKADFMARGAKVGFAFGSRLEKASGVQTTSYLNGVEIRREFKSDFPDAGTKMAKVGAKVGGFIADVSPVGEMKGRQKALQAFDSATESIKRRMWGG